MPGRTGSWVAVGCVSGKAAHRGCKEVSELSWKGNEGGDEPASMWDLKQKHPYQVVNCIFKGFSSVLHNYQSCVCAHMCACMHGCRCLCRPGHRILLETELLAVVKGSM